MSDILQNIWSEWQIEKELGRGSYGVVYKAVRNDHNLETHAAIKVISIPANAAEIDTLRSEGLDMNATKTYLQEIINDFVSEIRLMESLKGIQNIVSVEDYKVVEKNGELGWNIYIRMELLTPFNTFICDKKLAEPEVIKLGCDICTALEVCAKRNIIHRDIKPENIFINDFGDYKLGDFGIARKLENMTGGLSQKGTFNYMAPEVANSAEYDARVDTYSLGIVLYRLLNGNRLPFLDTEKQLLNPNERKYAVERRIRGEALSVPCEASPVMANLILRACAYDPNQRFSSATDMKQALLNIQNGAYEAIPVDVDATTAVRCTNNSKENLDGTTSVRRASQSNIENTPNTFGTKKKSKAPAIITAILAVVFLAGGGFLAYPHIANMLSSGQAGDIGGSEDKQNDTVKYSKSDNEQIASIISEAEAIMNDDIEGAITKIQTGLVTYPKSEDLQNKLDEYSDRLSAQIKSETLDKAAELADSGDYVAAMAVIETARKDSPDDADYNSAYISYETAHIISVKNIAISYSEIQVEKGDFIAAFQTLQDSITEIGEDVELLQKYNAYQSAYIDKICMQSDELMSKEKYDEAITLVNDALIYVNDTKKLKSKLAEINIIKPHPLVDDIQPYYSNDYELFNNGTSILMGGKSHYNGFTLNVYGWNGQSCAVFNLNKAYSNLTGIIGYVDNQIGDGGTWDVDIIADDEIILTLVIAPGELPHEFSIDLTNVSKLEFRTTDGRGFHGGIGFAELQIKGVKMEIEEDIIINVENQYLVDALEPYNSNDFSVFNNGTSIMMGGIPRYNGFVLDVYGWNGQSCAVYNLDKQYSCLTGIVSYVDGQTGDDKTWNIEILTDNYLVATYIIDPTSLPQEFTIDVFDVSKLEFRTTDGHGFHGRIGFAELEIN